METPLEAATATLKSADNFYRHCDAELREFMNKNTIVCNGQTTFVGRELADGEKLGLEYHRLFFERVAAGERFQAALEEYNRAKFPGHSFERGIQER